MPRLGRTSRRGDLSFVRRHHRKIERVAFASDVTFARSTARVAAPRSYPDFAHFGHHQIDEAIAWAGSATLITRYKRRAGGRCGLVSAFESSGRFGVRYGLALPVHDEELAAAVEAATRESVVELVAKLATRPPCGSSPAPGRRRRFSPRQASTRISWRQATAAGAHPAPRLVGQVTSRTRRTDHASESRSI